MSTLSMSNGDDHPEAASKHLLDAKALLDQRRPDGAAYLSGYVIECALKSMWLLEKRAAPGSKMPWGRQGHEVSYLLAQVSALATVAASRTARYFGAHTSTLAKSPVSKWSPEMRYRPPVLTNADAQLYHDKASDVYHETIHQMRLDGVI